MTNDLHFTKDKHLAPVDPQAQDSQKHPWWADMPLRPSDADLAVELEEVRAMAARRDEDLDDTGDEFRLPVLETDDGPYLSYFLTKSYKAGPFPEDQLIEPIVGTYMADKESYDDVLDGLNEDIEYGSQKPIVTGRDLGTAVHKDWPAQFYFRAALQLMDAGIAPQYRPTGKASFIEDGAADLFTVLAELHQKSLRVAWYHKWLNRCPRPEEIAAAQGDYLPMLFPEGCPVHPSYPAGHATCAGAGVTLLKCWFEDAEYGNSTVHRELNKLASNVAHGRSWAGVHFRSDNFQGLLLGERVAKNYLARMKPKLDNRMIIPLSVYQEA